MEATSSARRLGESTWQTSSATTSNMMSSGDKASNNGSTGGNRDAALRMLPTRTGQKNVKITEVAQKVATDKSWAHLVAGAYVFTSYFRQASIHLESFTDSPLHSSGGITAAVLTAPLDVLRTRFQSDFYRSQIVTSRNLRGVPAIESLSLFRSSMLHFSETIQILKAIPRVEGYPALFKGVGPLMTGVVPSTAIKFYTYGNFKRLITQHMNGGKEATWVHVLAAASTGIVVCTVTSPIWVVKTRVQLDRAIGTNLTGQVVRRRYTNAFDCASKILREEGVFAFYRGLSAGFLGVSETALQWAVYERMKVYLKARREHITAERDMTSWDEAVNVGGMIGAAGGSKLFAAIMAYPHEVARTRLRQAPMDNGRVKYTGLIQCFRLIVREEGVAALYGGLTPHLMRVVPSSAIVFGMYELTLRLLNAKA
jgi:solute carrier family 25 protein 33/36